MPRTCALYQPWLHRAAISSAAVALVLCLPSRGATAQQSSAGGSVADDNGQDFTSPQNLFQLRYRYQTAPASGGAANTLRNVTTDTLFLRSDVTTDLPGPWKLVVRTDLPLTAKNLISSDNPAGNYIYGLGDADLQAALIEQIDSRWAAGGGLRLYGPTGAEDITSGKWRVMPIVGIRANLPELSDGSYFTGIVRYDISFSGDPTKKNISNLQFDPMFNIALPSRWFFTLYPSADIRLNYGDPVSGQTGRLFLPADFMIGRNLSKNLALSLEVGVPIVKDYPVYNFKMVTRLNVRF